MALLSLHFCLHLTTLLFLHLLHGLKEELLNVTALIQDHLTDLLQV